MNAQQCLAQLARLHVSASFPKGEPPAITEPSMSSPSSVIHGFTPPMLDRPQPALALPERRYTRGDLVAILTEAKTAQSGAEHARDFREKAASAGTPFYAPDDMSAEEMRKQLLEFSALEGISPQALEASLRRRFVTSAELMAAMRKLGAKSTTEATALAFYANLKEMMKELGARYERELGGAVSIVGEMEMGGLSDRHILAANSKSEWHHDPDLENRGYAYVICNGRLSAYEGWQDEEKLNPWWKRLFFAPRVKETVRLRKFHPTIRSTVFRCYFDPGQNRALIKMTVRDPGFLMTCSRELEGLSRKYGVECEIEVGFAPQIEVKTP